MTGLHHLARRSGDGGDAEKLGEQDQARGLVVNGTGAGGEELEVGAAGFPEPGERRRESAGGGGRLVLDEPLLVRRVLAVFTDAPGAHD